MSESSRESILEKRIELYEVDVELVEEINKKLLHPNLEGEVIVLLHEFTSYPTLVATANFIREHYTKHGWNVRVEAVNIAGSDESPSIVRESHLRITFI